jgi:phosphoserine phosphatase RsbX
LQWGVASRALAGQTESGDQYLVELWPQGALVAVVDGLGHGNKAAHAAHLAIATLKISVAEPVEWLLQECHRELRQSRGVVMSLAAFNALTSTVTWLGVGNVEGVLLRAEATAQPVNESLLLRGGIVGYRLPPLRSITLPLKAGDTLIFVTDGIRSGFIKELSRQDNNFKSFHTLTPPQELANHVLARYSRDTDDALVLVARYAGTTPA